MDRNYYANQSRFDFLEHPRFEIILDSFFIVFLENFGFLFEKYQKVTWLKLTKNIEY